ncbi:MAG: TolC family protein [Deltaproteobacteria bacterium]|nr:TolC family protein [Deltaproteobacteria bacterium]
MMRLSLLLTVVIAIASCSSNYTYKQPSIPVPAFFNKTDISGKTEYAPLVKEITIHDFVKDKKLQALIAIAVENNRDLKISLANVQKAKEYFGIKRAELLPSLGIYLEGSRQRIPSDLSPRSESIINEQYSFVTGLVSWEIDIFGKIRAQKDMAFESYLAQKEISRAVKLSLITEVAGAYFTYAADQEILKIANDLIRTNTEIYEIVKKRYLTGMATEVELKHAEAQVENAKETHLRYLQETQKDKNALDLLVGISVPEELLPNGMADVVPLLDISSGLSSEILLTRPDIMALEHNLKSMNAQIEAARAAFFPIISLTSILGVASGELSGLFLSGSKTWTFKPQIKTPVFDTRVMKAHRLAKIEAEIAVLNYEKAIQNAFKEVLDCLSFKAIIIERKKAYQNMVFSLAEGLRLSKLRYEKGIDNYLSVLISQNSLLSAKIYETRLELLRNTNLLSLYKALGGSKDLDYLLTSVFCGSAQGCPSSSP